MRYISNIYYFPEETTSWLWLWLWGYYSFPLDAAQDPTTSRLQRWRKWLNQNHTLTTPRLRTVLAFFFVRLMRLISLSGFLIHSFLIPTNIYVHTYTSVTGCVYGWHTCLPLFLFPKENSRTTMKGYMDTTIVIFLGRRTIKSIQKSSWMKKDNQFRKWNTHKSNTIIKSGTPLFSLA